MREYKVEILDSNHVFTLRGKQIRTPVVFTVKTIEELELIKTLIRTYGFAKASITPVFKKEIEERIENTKFYEHTAPPRKNIKEKEASILNTLLKNQPEK